MCIRDSGWRTIVDLVHPVGDGDGALINRGTLNSGLALYVHRGRLHFDYNCFHDHTRAVAEKPLTPGAHSVMLDVTRQHDGSAAVTLTLDDAVVATARIPKLLFVLSSLGMDLGRSTAPINNDYQAPFVYPGQLRRVVFELGDKSSLGEVKAHVRAEMAKQ